MTEIMDRVERKSPEDLIPYQNNPKEHPEEQVDKIASSIKNYGFVQPIVVDGDNEIIIGHGRLKAAKKLELDEVPVIQHEDLSDSEIKALRLADNKVAESGWDQEMLEVELEQLQDRGFDLEGAGFTEGDLEGFDLGGEGQGEEQNKYTDKIETPVYEPNGEKPEIEELADREKFERLKEKIEESDIEEEKKEFLKMTAYRHIVFDYENIAEFYAQESEEVQELMEDLTLVVVDYDQAIEQGFVSFADEALEGVGQDE